MAREVVTTTIVTDDLGGPGQARPVTFSIDDQKWVIDLNKRNREYLVRRLEKFITAAHPIPPGYGRVRNQDAQKIRSWAATQGFEISDKGRIAESVLEAYRNA